MSNLEQQQTVIDMFNQAANEGTLDDQREGIKEVAAEVGLTINALKAMRDARNSEASIQRNELGKDLMARSNEADNWRHTGDS